MYRYLYRRCGDAALAEDLTGTTFLRLLEALHADKAWTKSFTGWLFRIAHNALTDHHRQRARHPEPALDDAEAERGPGTEERVRDRIEADEVRRALARLGRQRADYADVLLWRFVEGLSVRETAEVMGRSVGATKVLQHRALKSLRATLGVRFVGAQE